MLTELCQELHNYFDRERRYGSFSISGGNISVDFLLPGQYFRIMGSIYSDGVHQYPAAGLPDEDFTGSVWALAIPKAVVQLADDIDAWREKYEAIDSYAMSPYNSESFAGYSYSKSGSGGANGSAGSGVVSWKTAFAPRMNAWRKIHE